MGTISKEKFVSIMNNFMLACDATSKIDRTIRNTPILKETSDFFSSYCLASGNFSTVIDLLRVMFDDDENWIEYWAFENDFGRSLSDNSIRDATGTPINLKTAEDLYDFIVMRDMKVGGTD